MKRLMFILLLVATGNAVADEESPWRLGAAVGYGERSNPLALSEDIPIVVDLDIAWFGEHFFFDNGDIGFTFADNEYLTASAVARINSDRVFFSKTNTRFVTVSLAGQALSEPVELVIPDRDYAVEAGLELLAGGRWGRLQASVFHDVSGTHDGYEADVEYGLGFGHGRWYVEPSVGASYKSRAMNDYYWGVRPEESSEALPAYAANAGINLRAALRIGYYWSSRWSLAMSLQYERLNDDAAGSPIVVEDGVLGWFAGIACRL